MNLRSEPPWRLAVRRHRLLAFGSVVVALTGLVAVARLDRDTAPFALIFLPAIAALLVAGVADGRPAIGRLFRRIVRWRVAPRWYLAAIGIPIVMWLAVVAAGVATGVPVTALFGDLGTLPLVMLVVLIPAFVEEFGWRGYAVPVAPRSWSVLTTALVVGGLFIIPHLALYLPGGLYDNLPLWPLPFILLSYGVLLTWVYVGSGGSSFIAALMHAAFNGLTPLSRGIDPVTEWQLRGLVIAVIAIAVVLLSPSLRLAIAERRERGGAASILQESPA
jgi:membrane protease YdiL (CAAX protease family)